MIEKFVAQRVKELEGYKAEANDLPIILDKNELPWGLSRDMREAVLSRILDMEFNRYPDSSCSELKKAISKYTGIDISSIAVGNGSDELISIVLQTFISPGDTIAVSDPSFSMYKVYGSICGARIWEYGTDSSFETEPEEYISCLEKVKPKLVFLCNPNNPTGGRLQLEVIEEILKAVEGIVVVDEAYFEFSGLTAAGLLRSYENLIILRTFSKAFGLAALRLGYMLAAEKIISYIDRVRSPFNVSTFAQLVAIEALENIDPILERAEIIKQERERLRKLLGGIEGLKCYESWSNFLLIGTPKAGEIQSSLKQSGICVKSFSGSRLGDCLRITVGSPVQNDRLYECIKEVLCRYGCQSQEY